MLLSSSVNHVSHIHVTTFIETENNTIFNYFKQNINTLVLSYIISN